MPSLSLNKIGLGLELPAQTASFIFALDSLSASSAAAYSTRKLRSAYAGQCMNVRRSSDNATQDIGFVNNVLDTASLLTFVGANNGFVTKWYDQSGNGFDVLQATAVNQPQIVASGVVQTQGSKPSILFNGTTQFLATAASVATTVQSANAVILPTAFPVQAEIIRQEATVSGSLWGLRTSLTLYNFILASAAPGALGGTATSVFQIFTGTFNNGTNAAVYVNGTSVATNTSTPNGGANGIIGVGASSGGSEYWTGNITEITAFNTAMSTADRQFLEHNQESFYSITGV